MGVWVRMFVMGYALFLILVGVLEVVFHGLILSSWYCVVIAAIALGFFLATLAAGDEGMRVGRLFMNWWIISTYVFIVSVLYRISPNIVFGSWATILIFVALMAFIAVISDLGVTGPNVLSIATNLTELIYPGLLVSCLSYFLAEYCSYCLFYVSL
ncbi:MAG TPA: hypothetical protein VIX20_17095, partial [Ktedonobacteraceae bacterium]